MSAKAEAAHQGERAARSPWARGLARWGLVSRGLIYALVGLLALRVALWGRGSAPDRETALHAIADEPFGGLLLGAIAVGLAGYALWRLAQAFLGGTLERGGDDDEGVFKRVGYLGKAAFYGAIFASTLGILLGVDERDPRKEDRATAFVLDLPGGPWLVAGVGAAFVAAALFNFYRAVTTKFRERLKLRKMGPREDKAYTLIGSFGHAARGVVFGLIGVFLIRAAYQFDAEETVGLDGALSEIVHASYGPVLLGIVAAGLFAYGLYSFVEARYREV